MTTARRATARTTRRRPPCSGWRARRWGGTASPARSAWPSGLDVWDTARLFGLLNMALADGYIANWDVKYLYNRWRPETAIQLRRRRHQPADRRRRGVAPAGARTGRRRSTTPGTRSRAPRPAEVMRRVLGTDRVTFSACSYVDAGDATSAAARTAGQAHVPPALGGVGGERLVTDPARLALPQRRRGRHPARSVARRRGGPQPVGSGALRSPTAGRRRGGRRPARCSAVVRSAVNRSRSSRLRILPLTFLGISSMKCTAFGFLYPARRSRHSGHDLRLGDRRAGPQRDDGDDLLAPLRRRGGR